MKNKYPLSHREDEPEQGVLYIVATPIGNLSDISTRAINILKKVDYIASEDTRTTKKIMSKFNFHNTLISFNKINSASKIPNIINDLKSDYSIALVSDAGMPLICDPGEELVKICKQNNIDIIPIPGPCAAIAALVSSGFTSSRFVFEGFLPKKKIERQKILKEISKCDKTTILFESPHRLRKLLNELLDYCGEDREIEVSRELTKRYEEHIGITIINVIDSFKEREPKGEFTIVIKGFKKSNNFKFNSSFLKEELHNLVDAGLTLSSASKYLAKKNNLKKNDIYNLY